MYNYYELSLSQIITVHQFHQYCGKKKSLEFGPKHPLISKYFGSPYHKTLCYSTLLSVETQK